MLDTLKVALSSFQVLPNNSVKVQPATYEEGTGRRIGDYPLFRGEHGMVYGAKAFINGEKWNMDIKPIGGNVVAFLHFSVPKVHNGDNYYSVGLEGTQAVIAKVQGELQEAGVATDLQEASLSRVDCFSTVITEEPFESYAPIFSLMSASRELKREYGSTYLWHNGQQEHCIYDKCKEGELRGLVAGTYPEHSVRFEHRLLRKRKIETVYGFSKVRDLPSRWQVLREQYSKTWQKLFRYEAEELEVLAVSQVEQELRYFKERSGRQYLENYLKAVGASTFASEASREVLRQASLNVSDNRSTVFKFMRQVEQIRGELELLRQAPASQKTLRVLYSELKEGLSLN